MQNEPVTKVITTRTGPNTPEGLAAVTRNLPPPGESGPKTAYGKHMSSLNSLKHGLSANGLLSCRKDRCYVGTLCRLHNTAEGQKIFDATAYGDPCPIELAYYEDCARKLELEGVGDDAWRHLWALSEVRAMRRRMMTAVDQVSEDPPHLDRTDRHSATLWRERQALLAMLESWDPRTPSSGR